MKEQKQQSEMNKRMLEAQKKAEEQQKRLQKALDPSNIEFWEEKKKIYEQLKKKAEGEMAELSFLIEKFDDKIKNFNKSSKKVPVGVG